MIRACLAAIVLSVAAAPAQEPASRPAPGPKVRRLTVSPAREPEPALKYLLLPDYLDQTPGNAALLYHQAIAMMPSEKEGRSADQVAEWLQVTDPAALPVEMIKPVLDRYHGALHQVELGSRRETCRWELPIRSEGVAVLLPSLGKFRELARALALRIRLHIRSGRYDQAACDLQTGYALARHLGEDQLLIGDLVGVAVASIMTQQAAEWIATDGSPNLYWALADLPCPMVDLRDSLRMERNWLYLSFPRLRQAAREQLTPAQWRAIGDDLANAMGRLGGGDPGGGGMLKVLVGAPMMLKTYPIAKKHLLQRGMALKDIEAMPAQQVVALYTLAQYDRLRDEVFKWQSVPYFQAREGLKRSQEVLAQANKTGEGWPFASMIPSLGRARFLSERGDRQVAALRLVEAVRHYAATHEGQLPAQPWLERFAAPAPPEAGQLPLPLDPMTARPFPCTVRDGKLILDAPVPEDMQPDEADRYEITLRKQTPK